MTTAPTTLTPQTTAPQHQASGGETAMRERWVMSENDCPTCSEGRCQCSGGQYCSCSSTCYCYCRG